MVYPARRALARRFASRTVMVSTRLRRVWDGSSGPLSVPFEEAGKPRALVYREPSIGSRQNWRISRGMRRIGGSSGTGDEASLLLLTAGAKQMVESSGCIMLTSWVARCCDVR